jgi:hypothetical protein
MHYATLYTKIVDLYWLLKTMMRKAVLEWNEAHEDIFLNMNEIQMEILCLRRKDHLLSVNADGVGLSHGCSSIIEPPPSLYH